MLHTIRKDVIDKVLAERRWSYRALADATGIPHSRLAPGITGRLPIETTYVKRIANAVGVTFGDLTGEESSIQVYRFRPDVIEKRMTELGLSCPQIATACGVSAATISKWFNIDIKNPGVVHIMTICDFLELKIEDVVVRESEADMTARLAA